jgi:tetratricopeptide (TPR) repeat protein
MLIAFWISITAFTRAGYSQTIPEVLNLAGHYFDEQEFQKASELYRRVIFFDKSSAYDTITIPSLAACDFYLEKWDEAAEFFLLSFNVTNNHEFYIYHVVALMRAGKLMEAKTALLGMDDTTEERQVSKQILFGLIAFEEREFDDAKRYFHAAENSVPLSRENLDKIWKKTDKVARKTKLKAIVLSALLPGLGHTYAHHLREGANSFVLIAGIGAAYIFVAKNVGLIDGIISILPWFNRYYVGGLNGAAELTEQFKAESFDKLYNELVLISSQYIM